MRTCYIIGAGELYGELCPAEGDLVIAADGGADGLAAVYEESAVSISCPMALPCS